MRISAAVMAHPDRAEAVHELLARLDQPVEVSWDQEGPPSGNNDRVWRNARRAWEMHDGGADWHVLIQDDAVPCADLLAGLSQALAHVPGDAVVSCYLGQGRHVSQRWAALAARADDRGAAWIRTLKLMWGVCIAIPVPLIGQMIEHADRKAGVPDDMRVAGWVDRTKREVWYTWPSLVDHAQVPSLTKHRAPDRIARKHHQGSALAVSWDGPVVTDHMLTIQRGPRSGPRSIRPVR